MVTQIEFSISPLPKGYHLITRQVLDKLPEMPATGILHLFIKHTSAALSINENADPTVRNDFEAFFNHLVPESFRNFKHTFEGPDDMPAHIKASLIGNSIWVPITNHKLNLGTWQGIYLCEFRENGGSRQLVATISGI